MKYWGKFGGGLIRFGSSLEMISNIGQIRVYEATLDFLIRQDETNVPVWRYGQGNTPGFI